MLDDPRLAYCPMCDAPQIVPVGAENYQCQCGMDWETPHGRLTRLSREGWPPRVPAEPLPAWERMAVVGAMVLAVGCAITVIARLV